MSQCFVCNSNNASRDPKNTSSMYDIDCPACGNFRISSSAALSIQQMALVTGNEEEARLKISHHIRTSQNKNAEAIIDTYLIEKILQMPLPKPKEQADLFIRWIGETSKLGSNIPLLPEEDRSVIGSLSSDGIMLIAKYWKDKGLIEFSNNSIIDGDLCYELKLTLDGWMYYDNLIKGSVSYKKAFMAMKFGDDELNKILNDVFRHSVKDAGFELIKLDDTPKAGLLDNRLRVEIQSSDFIIADLSHDNLGAYWEAGYAEGLGKDVIYTCKKSKFEDTKTHFDTNHHLTIIWDPENPQDAGDQLKATIRATLPHLAIMTDD